MKNLLNLGKALNRAEQKEVFGGYGNLPDVCNTHGVGSSICECSLNGGYWNFECGICRPLNPLFGIYEDACS